VKFLLVLKHGKTKARFLWSFGEFQWSFIERVLYQYRETADETWRLGVTSEGISRTDLKAESGSSTYRTVE